jgi:hypothetical protein
MAADWIKVRVDLPDDPAVLAISRLLSISRDEVVGMLVRFWSWAQKYTEDGRILSASKADINRIVCGTDADEVWNHAHTSFADALEKVGWLDVKSDSVSIPKFDRHNSKSSKRRALDAERKAKSRPQNRPQSVRKMSASKADKMRTRVESVGREEKNLPTGRAADESSGVDANWNGLEPNREEEKSKGASTDRPTGSSELVKAQLLLASPNVPIARNNRSKAGEYLSRIDRPYDTLARILNQAAAKNLSAHETGKYVFASLKSEADT